MTKDIKQTIDLSIRRRRYYSDECGLVKCPECNTELKEEGCTILLAVKSDKDEGEFMTNLAGSHFCTNCPVVVFDIDKLEQAAKYGIRSDKNLKYLVGGIVDLNAIPKDKRELQIGTDENPMPLVHFLPDLNTGIDEKLEINENSIPLDTSLQNRNNQKITNKKKVGRNEPCPCGSGKKYKKCCGKK